jgi:hypothetical protein
MCEDRNRAATTIASSSNHCQQVAAGRPTMPSQSASDGAMHPALSARTALLAGV